MPHTGSVAISSPVSKFALSTNKNRMRFRGRSRVFAAAAAPDTSAILVVAAHVTPLTVVTAARPRQKQPLGPRGPAPPVQKPPRIDRAFLAAKQPGIAAVTEDAVERTIND